MTRSSAEIPLSLIAIEKMVAQPAIGNPAASSLLVSEGDTVMSDGTSTPTPARPTVTSLDVKLGTLKRQVDQNTADVARGTLRLDLGDKRHKRVERQIGQIQSMVKVLGERLAETHDIAVTGEGSNLEERVTALVAKALESGQVGGQKSFIQTLRDAQVDDATISHVLIIARPGNSGELQLTDAELFTELFTAFITLYRTVENHTFEIHELTGRVATVENTVAQTRTYVDERVTTIQNGHRVANWGLLLALLAWLVASILWAMHTWKQTAVTKIGKQTGTTYLRYHLLNSGWTALVVGFGVACVVLLLVSLIPNEHQERVTQTVNRRRRAVRNNQGNTPGQPIPIAPAQPAPAPAPQPVSN